LSPSEEEGLNKLGKTIDEQFPRTKKQNGRVCFGEKGGVLLSQRENDRVGKDRPLPASERLRKRRKRRRFFLKKRGRVTGLRPSTKDRASVVRKKGMLSRWGWCVLHEDTGEKACQKSKRKKRDSSKAMKPHLGGEVSNAFQGARLVRKKHSL